MKLTAVQVRKALEKHINPDKAAFFPRFFKAGPGEYAEGDQFLGVVVPDQRKIARSFRELPLVEIQRLLESDYHECRLTGILILVTQYQKAKTEAERKTIFDFYLANIDNVNNWDLVDSSAHKIVGPFLENRNRKRLYQLARAKHLWKNRVAVIATLHYIKQGDLGDTLEISRLLLDHPHDLIHKAVGWMLRECGKVDIAVLRQFIDQHGTRMPRTMLRYAIEKLSREERAQILNSTRP